MAEAVREVARKSPETFVAIAAKVCPFDVRVTLVQQLPGNLTPEEWATMREIVEAVRQAIPDASSKSPGTVLEHVGHVGNQPLINRRKQKKWLLSQPNL